MPSGSRAGSSGSHFGSSSGSHFRGSSRGGSSSHSHDGPGMRMGPHHHGGGITFVGFFKHGIYTTIGVCAFLFVVMIAVCLGCRSSVVGYQQKINVIKADHSEYIKMIERAEKNPEYQTTAYVTGRRLGKGDKWFVDYEIRFTANGKNEVLNGYTYPIYSFDEIDEFTVGDEIIVALNCKNTEINGSTDSVNMDYKNYGYKADGEYIYYRGNIRNLNIIIAVIAVALSSIIVICIVCAIVSAKRKKNQETVSEVNSNPTTTTSTSSNSTSANSTNICPYCGSKIPEGSSKCPGCGAR